MAFIVQSWNRALVVLPIWAAQTLIEIKPDVVDFGRTSVIIWPMTGQFWSTSTGIAPRWTMLDRLRPNSIEIVKHWPIPGRKRTMSIEIGRAWPNFDRLRHSFGQSSPGILPSWGFRPRVRQLPSKFTNSPLDEQRDVTHPRHGCKTKILQQPKTQCVTPSTLAQVPGEAPFTRARCRRSACGPGLSRGGASARVGPRA